jgi:hypothetical protein
MVPDPAVRPGRCRGAVLAAVFVVFVLSMPGFSRGQDTGSAALSPETRALTLRYDAYVGGFYAFGFDVTLGLDSKAYDVAVEGGTRGVVGKLFAWRTHLSSEGGLAASSPLPSGLAPVRFDNVTEWRGKPRRTTLRFMGRGRYAVERDPAEPPASRSGSDDDTMPASLPAGAMDPVAAAVAALAASARDGACERRVPVFDGKRRYDLLVHDGDGPTSLTPSHFSAYAGPALSCRIAIARISGFSKRRRNAGQWDEASGNLPTIWVARLMPDMPLVPVRFMASIDLGTLVLHLMRAEARESGTTRILAELRR